MNLKLIKAVATEPITLAEAKAHLCLDSSNFADDITSVQSIAPGAHVIATNYSLVGVGIDVLGYSVLVNLESGTNGTTNGTGGTVDVKIQESNDDITYTDWIGGIFTRITTTNDNATYMKEYTGTKRYIRAVATVAGAVCEFGVSVLKDDPTEVENLQLSKWITAAREYGEICTGRAFATQTWELMLDDFPDADGIDLPYPPLQSVTSVKYTDSAGAEKTMVKTTEYLVDDDTEPGKIFLPYNAVWPFFTPYPCNAVRIEYICGYDGTTLIIPEMLKQAMLFHIGLMYKYRDAGIPILDMQTLCSLYYPCRLAGVLV